MTWVNSLKNVNTEKIILAKDRLVNNNAFKNYKEFESYDQMLKFVDKKNPKHFYEVTKDMKKPYFDIEIYCEQSNEADIETYKNEFKTLFINTLINYFKDELKEELDIFSFNIAESSGLCKKKKKYKISYHIVLSGYRLTTNHMKYLHKDFIEYAKETDLKEHGKLDEIIDKNVYKTNQLWRMVNSSKITDASRVMKFVNNQDMKKHLIGYIEDTEKLLDLKYLEEKYTKKTYKITPNITEGIHEGFDIEDEDSHNYIKNEKNEKIINYLLTKCIKQERADDYNDWLTIGASLYNTDRNYLSLFTVWSRKSTKYENINNNCCCQKLWSSFDRNKLEKITIKTLLYFAKIDNEENYSKYFNMFNLPITTKTEIPHIPFNKIENAYRKDLYGYCNLFSNTFKGRISYSNKEWYVWDGDLWKTVSSEFIQTLIIHTFENLLTRFKFHIQEEDRNNEFEDGKGKCEISKTIAKFYKLDIAKKIENLIKNEEGLLDNDFYSKLDCNEDILSVKNGIVDLKTGKLRQRKPEDNCTFKINIDYKENDINYEFVNKFFMELLMDDQEMVDFLQVFLGYSSTGHVSEQKFAVLNGVGSNGKSVLLKTLHSIFGEYFNVLHKNVLMNDKPTNTQDYLVALKGSRIAICDESEANEKLNSSGVKMMTGGAPIKARAIYKDPIEFKPTFQLMLLTNHLPKASSMDSALWRRLILIPFERQFLKESDPKYNQLNPKHKKMDPRIFEQISENKEEFLRWFVDGAVKWYQNGIPPLPKKIYNVTHEYRLENDRMYRFLKESCDINKKNDVNKYTCKIKDIADKLKQEGIRYQYDSIKKMLSYHGYIYDVDLVGFEGFRIKPHLMENNLYGY